MVVRLNISLITPAVNRSRSGNRVTAVRWARLLKALGHKVSVATPDVASRSLRHCDLMVAIHAWRSAPAIDRYRELHPHRPLVVLKIGRAHV